MTATRIPEATTSDPPAQPRTSYRNHRGWIAFLVIALIASTILWRSSASENHQLKRDVQVLNGKAANGVQDMMGPLGVWLHQLQGQRIRNSEFPTLLGARICQVDVGSEKLHYQPYKLTSWVIASVESYGEDQLIRFVDIWNEPRVTDLDHIVIPRADPAPRAVAFTNLFYVRGECPTPAKITDILKQIAQGTP